MTDFLVFIEAALRLVPIVIIAAPIVSLMVDALKKAHALPDDKAGVASLILNATFWIALTWAGKIGVRHEAEAVINQLAQFAPVMAALILAIVGSKWFHDKVALPLGIGYSHMQAKLASPKHHI